MPDSPTAEIIPFPARPIIQPPPSPVNARLAQAVIDLDAALTVQRTAIVAWRAAIGDMRTVTRRLGTTLKNYNDSMGGLAIRVQSLRTEAVRLQHWADDAATGKR